MEGESILGIIPNASLKKGLFKREVHNLIITNKRLIAAKFTTKLMKEEIKKQKEKLKEEKKGIFKQFLSAATIGYTFHERYLKMDPDEIIKESNENFFLLPENVPEIILRKGAFHTDENGIVEQDPHRIIINSNTSKLNFSVKGNIGELKKILSQLFPKIK